ncbi:MAG: AEC family transporter [Rhodoplanes sp.]|uniref:AEC family transporter n=1 Tax=Rhodoplanes sp. TaxID=1968906 RepID=UPI0017ACC0FC|nr:AEC family transporter [Rhodoplanes sp.]NVO17408.1 AEC family transporter [Rhodoplanes sp.]
MTGPVLLALVPIALLIGLGHGLKRTAFLADAFWPQAERLAYFVLLPALFLHGLATTRIEALPVWEMAVTLIGSILAVAALVVMARPLMRIDGAGFTSVFQGSVRFNNYVAVTIAVGLFGAQGITLSAICTAAIVPVVNILCVLVFARFGAARLSARGVVIQIVSNPLVLGCVGGIALQATGLGLPPGLEPALRALGAASLPLGLLCVGAALDFGAARRWLAPVAVSSAAKFLLMPVVALAGALALGLRGPPLVVVLLFEAMPTASSAYILSRQLGGDAPLMAGITAVQTVLAAVAIPLVLTVLLALAPP